METLKNKYKCQTIKGIFIVLFFCSFFLLIDLVPVRGVVTNAAAETEEGNEEAEEEECEGDECEGEDEEESEEYKLGKKKYEAECFTCHGHEGDGKGEAYRWTWPKPRDFTSGTYKFRSTPSGDPPTDDDIKRTIKKGLPGTSMEAYEKKLTDDEIDGLIEYIKAFSEETFEFPGEPIEIGEAPPVTDELIEKGKKLFKDSKCWECHGKYGRGDGEKGWQEKFKDDWGERIYPTSLTNPWEIRNGSTVKDLYRSVTTGLDGTPMASFENAYSNDDRWALAHFLKSIQIKRHFGHFLKMHKVSNIPSSTEDELWEKVEYIDIPVGGKKLFGQSLIPMITNIHVRGCYTGSEVAIMLEWVDKKPNKSGDGYPPDAVRLQFPVSIPQRNPLFYKEDRKILLNYWHWKASDNLALELNAIGPRERDITEQQNMDVKAISSYKDGLYRVIFIRKRNTGDKDDFTFKSGTRNPFLIFIYDGENNEIGNRAGVTSRYYLILD